MQRINTETVCQSVVAFTRFPSKQRVSRPTESARARMSRDTVRLIGLINDRRRLSTSTLHYSILSHDRSPAPSVDPLIAVPRRSPPLTIHGEPRAGVINDSRARNSRNVQSPTDRRRIACASITRTKELRKFGQLDLVEVSTLFSDTGYGDTDPGDSPSVDRGFSQTL